MDIASNKTTTIKFNHLKTNYNENLSNKKQCLDRNKIQSKFKKYNSLRHSRWYDATNRNRPILITQQSNKTNF